MIVPEPIIYVPKLINGSFGKFIQIWINADGQRTPIFRLSEGSILESHGNILEQTLNEFHIDFKRYPDDGSLKSNLPEINSSEYEMVGAGYSGVIKKLLFAFDDSSSYRLEPNREHFQALAQRVPGFRFELRRPPV